MPGSALAIALGDAIYAELAADAELATLARAVGATVTIAPALPDGARTETPYVIVGDRALHGTGFAMGLEGGEGEVIVDVWSDFNGPEEAQDIQGRIRALLLRDPLGHIAPRLLAAGVVMFAGSLACPEERVFQDWDPLMPSRSLYHGVQRWQADIEEVA